MGINTSVALTILKSRLGQLALVGSLACVVGAGLHKRLASPTLTTTIVHDIQQVRVEVPILTKKTIDRIIVDPKQQEAIKLLVKENNELKLKIIQISSTVAINQTGGGTSTTGTITQEPNPNLSTQPEVLSTFKDYQLNATYSTKSFDYKLSQTFLIESSTGKDANGHATGIVRLYQDTPSGLTPLLAKTTVIVADPNPSRWFLSPRLQGGINFAQDKTKAAFIGLQLIKHGTSKDPKDLKYAVGTIGLRLGDSTIEPTIIPLNFNVGSPKFSPFSNLWIGPSITLKKQVGLIISATF